MDVKTNAIRIVEQNKISYERHDYPTLTSGMEIANFLGKDPNQLFKTLVTVGKSKQHYVFMIPVSAELDLKKAAAAAGEKAIEMVLSKELLPLTGYIHGGCSPIGMKKAFPTFIDEVAEIYPTICFSGGKIGIQLEMPLSELRKVVDITIYDLTK